MAAGAVSTCGGKVNTKNGKVSTNANQTGGCGCGGGGYTCPNVLGFHAYGYTVDTSCISSGSSGSYNNTQILSCPTDIMSYNSDSTYSLGAVGYGFENPSSTTPNEGCVECPPNSANMGPGNINVQAGVNNLGGTNLPFEIYGFGLCVFYTAPPVGGWVPGTYTNTPSDSGYTPAGSGGTLVVTAGCPTLAPSSIPSSVTVSGAPVYATGCGGGPIADSTAPWNGVAYTGTPSSCTNGDVTALAASSGQGFGSWGGAPFTQLSITWQAPLSVFQIEVDASGQIPNGSGGYHTFYINAIYQSSTLIGTYTTTCPFVSPTTLTVS